MDFAGPDFVIAIVAVSTAGWLINNWIRARHGYALEDEWGGKTARADATETLRLETENAKLRGLLAKLEDRTQVLERIVTDKGYTVAEQIEGLRDKAEAN